MKIRVIALNTLAGLLRDKLIVVFCAVFLCVVLLMLAPLRMMRAMPSAAMAESAALGMIGAIMSIVSGFGSLLAAWASADAVASEIRSGTILAVLARPVHRWEFLLGKYLGVQLLMSIFVLFLFVFSYLLAWIGGAQIHSAPWVLIVYPMARYALYSALAMLLATILHPTISFAIVLVLALLSMMVVPGRNSFLPPWLHTPLYAVLPSTGLLSEERFLTITKAALKPIPWSEHATALAYGLDYSLVVFLLAVWLFRHRSVTRE
jgi:ABC-type transport system involved in multi-copper enzyme maturation permease subunit